MQPSRHTASKNTRLQTLVRRAFVAALAVMLTFTGWTVPAGTAAASDWGGYRDPGRGCGGNYVVSSAPVYARQWDGRSLYIGKLEIKWSHGCPGNYARFAAAGGINPTSIGISIHAKASPYNKAGADETRTRVAYTRVIELRRSSDRVCAYLDVNLYSGRELLHGGKVLCA